MKVQLYRVGGLLFELRLPDDVEIERLLPSFWGFEATEVVGEEPAFCLQTQEQALAFPDGEVEVLEESDNDMGHVRLSRLAGYYLVEVCQRMGGVTHRLLATADFRKVQACLHWEDTDAGAVLSSMVRIVYSQAVLLHRGVSLHASCVVSDGKAYLFMGKSGTGKSTHSRLWLEHFPNVELLNDDNPVVCLEDDDRVYAYGTPWSGKTPCYKNRRYPVGGIVRLKQAPRNIFYRKQGVEAFVALLPGTSGIRQDERLDDALCETLAELAERVTVGGLECRPDKEAAEVCREGIVKR